MPRFSEGKVALGGLAALAIWTLVVLPIFYGSAQGLAEVIPQCHREHHWTYCFLQDQGSSLGAVATLAAVIVALWLPIWQSRRQNRSRLQDLFRALDIEADRLRTLAADRMTLVNQSHGQALRALDQRYNAIRIFTIGVMREGSGMSDLPSSVAATAAALIARVDKLNSLVETKGPFGTLTELPTLNALQEIITWADTLLREIQAHLGG